MAGHLKPAPHDPSTDDATAPERRSVRRNESRTAG